MILQAFFMNRLVYENKSYINALILSKLNTYSSYNEVRLKLVNVEYWIWILVYKKKLSEDNFFNNICLDNFYFAYSKFKI